MNNSLKIWSALILFLFLFPVLIHYLPSNGTVPSTKLIKEPTKIVYASNITEEDIARSKKKKALIYYTHSHEAFEPITKSKNGKIAVSHQTENIMKFGEQLKKQMEFSGVQTDILAFDNMLDMKQKGIPFSRAYQAIRPHVEQQIAKENYDLIIDLHRDSLRKDKTTMTHKGESYAKVAFVIGLEHENASKNEALANELKSEMEKIVPGITRGIIRKKGRGVDGKYNQDLHSSILLVELGGIGNEEAELNRTVSVIGKASEVVLSNR